jgi:hypothetical protein
VKNHALPKPPYISVEISHGLVCTVTGPTGAVRLFADLLLEQCRTLYYSLETAKQEGAKISYATHHPYHFPEMSRPVDLTQSQIDKLIRKRSTLSQMLDRKIWLGAFEGDCNLSEIEPRLGLVHHTINESVWRSLPPAGFPEFEKHEVFDSFRNFRKLKIIPDRKVAIGEMKRLFESLQNFLQKPIALAIAAGSGTIFFEITHHTADREIIEKTFAGCFPNFALLDSPGVDTETLETDICEASCSLISLSRDDPGELVMTGFHGEPLGRIVSVLDGVLEAGCLARYEVLCRPYRSEAIRAVIHYLEAKYPESSRSGFADRDMDYLYDGARETLRVIGARNPIWSVNVRISTAGRFPEEAERYLTELYNAVRQFEKEDRPWIATDLKESFEAGLDELAALFHFPSEELPSDYLEVAKMKNKLPPDLYSAGTHRIGTSEARGQTKAVYLPEEVRGRHVYIVGKSGTGKSTLIETIARADILAGKGVAVIDPHGDVIDNLLRSVPEERVDDVVYFNPRLCPVSLDILSAENEHEIDLLADDLITMFRRTSEAWGDRMQAILQMTFQTLLRVKGTSFTDITPFLTDEGFRARVLSKIDHPQLLNFWTARYDVRQAEPILIRMDRLTTSESLRYILTQNKRSLNFDDVIGEGRIFLADLGKGFLGEATSHLIGSIIVSQIQLASQRQMQLPQEQRIPFSLFVDEVQNFTTDAFGTILSEARKQKLQLCIGHQFVSQLPLFLQKAVFGNVGTLVFFTQSPDDLGAARHELGDFEVKDIANLPKFNALCRPVTAARDTFSFAAEPPPPLPRTDYVEDVIENMKQEFGVPDLETEDSSISDQTEFGSIGKPDEPLPGSFGEESAAAEVETHSPTLLLRPAEAEPIEFYTNAEKIMHFIRQAEYLSQPQIIALTDLQPSNASTALKKLVRSGQIKNLDSRRPKIYCLGKNCNPTTHNLLIRDLFVKINASAFSIGKVDFNKTLPGLNPDLAVEFISDNRKIFPVYFEIDRGTEGVRELVSKAERYSKISEIGRVGIIFERESDMELARSKISSPSFIFALINDFTSLRDEAFYSAPSRGAESEPTGPHPFFI